MIGKALAEDIMDSDNNDELKILIAANTEITQEIIDLIKEKNVSKFKVLVTNDLDKGLIYFRYIELDTTQSRMEALIEIYRMMRPGEPPTEESADTMFDGLFLKEISMTYQQ